jgi:hypothetical protein
VHSYPAPIADSTLTATFREVVPGAK